MSDELNVVEETKEEITTTEEIKKGKKSKKVLSPEQKKKKTTKALIITAVVVLVLSIFFGSIAISNNAGTNKLITIAENYSPVEYTLHTQLVPAKDADGYYTFYTDNDLKVMQITDVHIGGGSFSQQKDQWALAAVATMIRYEQPDLVVVTGDIAYPVPFQAGTFNNLNATKIFANMMESLQVYWTFVYGNHDTELYSMYTRKEICEYYENAIANKEFKYCLFSRGAADANDSAVSDMGFGNNIIKVMNSKGIVTQAIVTMDSHSYIDGDYFGIAWKYDNLHQSQVDWYKQEMDKLQKYNKVKAEEQSIVGYVDQPVKNTLFIHIPLVEYREAWKQIKESGIEISNAQTKSECETNAPIVINSDITYYYGHVGEKDGQKNGVKTHGVFCGYHQDELFETGLTCGLQAVFCGHDHYNNFSISYKGIRLTYGKSIDYLAYPTIYKEHGQRGCTVITIKPDGSFECGLRDYYVDYGVVYEA